MYYGRPKTIVKEIDKIRQQRKRDEEKEKRKREEEKIEREEGELWKEIKEELEFERKDGGKVSKETYFVIGKALEKYKKGKRELSQHQIKAAKRIYLMYKTDKEFDDGVGIGEVVGAQKLDLTNLTRKKWVSKILGGRSCYGKPI